MGDTADTSSELMLYALWSPAYAQGGFHIGQNGEPVPSNKIFITDESREKLVAHYNMEVASK